MREDESESGEQLAKSGFDLLQNACVLVYSGNMGLPVSIDKVYLNLYDALEVLIKASLSLYGCDYKKTHNLSKLSDLLVNTVAFDDVFISELKYCVSTLDYEHPKLRYIRGVKTAYIEAFRIASICNHLWAICKAYVGSIHGELWLPLNKIFGSTIVNAAIREQTSGDKKRATPPVKPFKLGD